ncbi:hypothetical protein EOL72_02290 [Candidatus Falkowbacteria bacterium]|nr:hypothetical protein [Candidatus Falkowbacteria bacterium]
MDQNYFNYCLEKFNDLPDSAREFLNKPDTAEIVKKIENKYELALSFLVVLVAVSELGFKDISAYLERKYKIEKSRSELIATEIIDKIFIPFFDQQELSNPEDIKDALAEEESIPEPLINLPLRERRQLILDIFSEGLVKTLEAESSELKELNLAIFKTFNDDPLVEEKVESLLYNNQEKLTTNNLVLDSYPASPTIANWLKDFIKLYGSSLFSEISLAEYLVRSPNLKNLPDSEKQLVRKLLKLYRNLTFFPESMDGVLLENWELFPLEVATSDSLGKINKIPDSLNSSSREEEPDSPFIPEEKIDLAPQDNNERGQLISNLEKSLVKYDVSSLEHKALQQEINRLKREA